MEEENKDKKKDEGEKAKPTNEDTDRGDKPEVYKPIDDANLAAKRLEDATKAQREENDRTEEITAKRALGGVSEAGSVTDKPKRLTDQEYAEAMTKGEVNPFKEDGFI